MTDDEIVDAYYRAIEQVQHIEALVIEKQHGRFTPNQLEAHRRAMAFIEDCEREPGILNDDGPTLEEKIAAALADAKARAAR